MKKINLALQGQEMLTKDQMKTILGGTGGGLCEYGLQTPCLDDQGSSWGTAYNRSENLCANWEEYDRDEACLDVNAFTQSNGCSCANPA